MVQRVTIKPEPARCVCRPGAVAREQHAKPGHAAGLHLNPACPHSTLANDCGGYEALRMRHEAARAEKAAKLAAAKARQRRPIATLVH
jgi:hypothetical protein